jgi:hypothetical protein
MAPRNHSRKLAQKQKLEEAARLKKLDQLRVDFPQELEQLRNLEPLRSRPDLLDGLFLKLGEIVYLGRLRIEQGQIDLTVRAIKSSNDAAANIATVVEGLANMDDAALDTVLAVTQGKFPQPYFVQDVNGLFKLLEEFRVLMMTLHRTMKFGTGLSDERRRTGRPPSPYLQLTILLINAWESLIAEQYSDDTALAPIITRVPMPKRLDTSDVERKKSKIVSKQPSTEFILTALRMINPNIKDAEVFTAIKKVLKQRKILQTYIANHPSIYVRRTKLVARSSTREMRVQKKPL